MRAIVVALLVAVPLSAQTRKPPARKPAPPPAVPLKKGKGDLVSVMTYPGEFHYFTREHVLRDAWHRVDDFFEKYLKP